MGYPVVTVIRYIYIFTKILEKTFWNLLFEAKVHLKKSIVKNTMIIFSHKHGMMQVKHICITQSCICLNMMNMMPSGQSLVNIICSFPFPLFTFFVHYLQKIIEPSETMASFSGDSNITRLISNSILTDPVFFRSYDANKRELKISQQRFLRTNGLPVVNKDSSYRYSK